MQIPQKKQRKNDIRIFQVSVFLILCLLLNTTVLNAFRPSASWLINEAVKYQLDRKIKNLKAVYQVVSYESGETSNSIKTVYTQAPNLYAEKTEDSNGVSKKIIRDQRQLLINSAQQKKQSDVPANFWRSWQNIGPKLSQDQGLTRIKKSLKAHGVSLTKVSYKRLQGHICYVIGDGDSPSSSQLWLSKESLLPMQISWTKGKDFFQLKLTAWNSPQGGEWLPQHTYLFKNNEMVEESHLDQVERNINIPQSIFSFKD